MSCRGLIVAIAALMTSSAAAAPAKAPASAPQSTTTPKSTLTVRIFDAGHGDGILLRTSSGHRHLRRALGQTRS